MTALLLRLPVGPRRGIRRVLGLDQPRKQFREEFVQPIRDLVREVLLVRYGLLEAVLYRTLFRSDSRPPVHKCDEQRSGDCKQRRMLLDELLQRVRPFPQHHRRCRRQQLGSTPALGHSQPTRPIYATLPTHPQGHF